MAREISLEELREIGISFPAKDKWKQIKAGITLEWLMRDAKLSHKLISVMELVAQGFRDMDIMEKLGLSPQATNNRKRRAIRKIQKILEK